MTRRTVRRRRRPARARIAPRGARPTNAVAHTSEHEEERTAGGQHGGCDPAPAPVAARPAPSVGRGRARRGGTERVGVGERQPGGGVVGLRPRRATGRRRPRRRRAASRRPGPRLRPPPPPAPPGWGSSSSRTAGRSWRSSGSGQPCRRVVRLRPRRAWATRPPGARRGRQRGRCRAGTDPPRRRRPRHCSPR